MATANTRTGSKTRALVEGAAMVALATALSYVRIFKLPWGGSITLLSMLPIVFFSIRRGLGAGFAASFVFSLFQFVQGILDGLFGWGLTPGMLVACIFLDYIGAFTILGIAGIFRKKGLLGEVSGSVLAVFLRFIFHFLSGVVIWHSAGKLWEGFETENSWLYSLLYNGAYMLPELILTTVAAVVFLHIPQIRRLVGGEDIQ
ncbi:MAG: energy-coupled thiamine transporter ThiT [Lachnospiraceae bacterium]|nr:energy-coupled thiamine transporter ThiT [Lachnospiraceae bacterium]